MDHRWSRRQDLCGEVQLAMPGQRPVAVKVGDLSLGGVRVEGFEQRLPVDGFVTLAFSVIQADGASHHRVLAQVVHCHDGHAGLIFVDPARDTVHALRAALAHPPHAGMLVLVAPPVVRAVDPGRATRQDSALNAASASRRSASGSSL